MKIYDLEWINSNFPGLDQVETLNSGGQKEVFKGYHKKYGEVVLKIIKPSDDEYQRTIREIKAAEIIESDHVPKIYQSNLSEAKPAPIWLLEQYLNNQCKKEITTQMLCGNCENLENT
jgi:serine/threonine protein kinase